MSSNTPVPPEAAAHAGFFCAPSPRKRSRRAPAGVDSPRCRQTAAGYCRPMLPGSELPWERRSAPSRSRPADRVPRLGAAPASSRSMRVGDREHALEPRRLRRVRGELAAAPGERLRVRRRRHARCPTRARAGSRRACAGRSRLLDTGAFEWTDDGFGAAGAARRSCSTSCTSARSRPRARSRRAIPHLRGLRELGVTAIELMPVAEFPGRHGWGYDGVYISAAQSAYGGPRGLAAARRRRPRRGARGAARRRLQPRRRLRHAGD